VGDGWTRPPLEMTIEDGRAYGRGVCDIKGAAAALLTLARTTDAPMAMLFTTDEEGAHGCCVREYVSSIDATAWDLVVVAEPTLCQAVLGHRGYLSVIGNFAGVAGHSSEQRGLTDSAVHKLMDWGAKAVAQADGADACFNIGQVVGGVKSNVIANQAEVRWSARLAPGRDNQAFFEKMTAHARDAEWQLPFTGPPLPAAGQDANRARDQVARFKWPTGGDVDFWTEASLFSGGELPALVLGPGDIAQAHTADEWVALDQLDLALERYREVLNHE
jgi:acetylornithine deacetylase